MKCWREMLPYIRIFNVLCMYFFFIKGRHFSLKSEQNDCMGIGIVTCQLLASYYSEFEFRNCCLFPGPCLGFVTCRMGLTTDWTPQLSERGPCISHHTSGFTNSQLTAPCGLFRLHQKTIWYTEQLIFISQLPGYSILFILMQHFENMSAAWQ